MANVSIKPYELEQAAKEFDKIVGKLNNLSGQVNFVKGCLTPFSGFGIGNVITALDNTDDKLELYRDDLVAERDSLKKIVNIATTCDREVGNIFNENVVSDVFNSAATNTGLPNSLLSYFEWIKSFIADNFDLKEYLDTIENNYKYISKLLDISSEIPAQFLSLYFNLYKTLKSISELTNLDDKSVSKYISEVFGVLKNGGSTYSTIYKLLEKVDGFEMSDIDKLINSKDSLGVSYWDVAKVCLATLQQGFKSYDLYSADGEMSVIDWSEVGIDSGMKGLAEVISVIPIIGWAFSYLDKTYDLTDDATKGLKSWADGQAEDISNTLMNNEKLYDFYNKQNPVVQNLIMTSLIDPRYRTLVKYFS